MKEKTIKFEIKHISFLPLFLAVNYSLCTVKQDTMNGNDSMLVKRAHIYRLVCYIVFTFTYLTEQMNGNASFVLFKYYSFCEMVPNIIFITDFFFIFSFLLLMDYTDLNKMVHRQEIGTLGNVQSACTGRKPREPVEDTEDAEDFKGFGQNSVDDLTKALTVCSLASEEEKSSHTLEKTFASLVVSGVACTEDKDENSDSHSSIITIDPPSLPHVKEDADGEPFDEVISRGPTSGKPVCFSQKSCNRIAEKSYYSHNFDKYFAPLQAGEEKPQCFQSQINRNYCSNLNPPFMTDTIHTGNFTFENSGTKSGKRQNPDGDVPFKYIRPNMESEISQQNNLNFEMNSKRPIYPQVMSSIGPGAQVNGTVLLFLMGLVFYLCYFLILSSNLFTEVKEGLC